MKKQSSAPPLGRSIYTLAQNETDNRAIILQGDGTDLSNKKAMQGRAKRKLITQSLMHHLIDIAKQKKDLDKVQPYWNTFHCQNKVHSFEGRLYGRYCKNRFCTLCCSVRKAQILNRYLPVIASWKQPYFVTITARSVPLKSLKRRLQDMLRGFRILSSRYRKRAQRGKGIKLVGIRSLECNYNPVAKTYNPHLHLVVESKEMAEIIKHEWLKLCTDKFAVGWAQKLIKIDMTEATLIEVVKYSSKIFTEPDGKGSKGKKINPHIYVRALHNIFKSMQGLRIFDRFGFNLPRETAKKESKSILVNQQKDWAFDMKAGNWINLINGATLTDDRPDIDLMDILANKVDKEKE